MPISTAANAQLRQRNANKMNLTLQHRNIDFDFSKGGPDSKDPRREAAEGCPHGFPRPSRQPPEGFAFFPVRLKAHLVREVEVLFRHALSGL